MSTVVIGHWPRQAWGTQAVDAPSVGQVPSQPPSAPPPDEREDYLISILWETKACAQGAADIFQAHGISRASVTYNNERWKYQLTVLGDEQEIQAILPELASLIRQERGT